MRQVIKSANVQKRHRTTKAVRQLISRRTRVGLQEAKARGVKLGNPRPSTDMSKLTPLAVANLKRKANKFAHRIIPKVLVLLKQGWTLADIAAQFNRRQIKTARGGRWHATTVRNILLRVMIMVEDTLEELEDWA